MSISMIDRVQFALPGVESSPGENLLMTVGGPLKLDKASVYAPPATVKFVIIQSPKREPGQEEEGHDPNQDQRVRGVVNVDPNTDRWEATVELDPSRFRAGEARGVAMAVMEKDGEYAYETLTWCDFVLMPEPVPGAMSELADGGPTNRGVRRWQTNKAATPLA